MTDFIFTFSLETWGDAADRQFCRPPDQMALFLLRQQPSRGLVVDALRNPLQRSYWRRDGYAGTRCARHVRPVRVRREDPLVIEDLVRQYRALSRRLVRAAGRARLSDPFVITFNPFVAAFGDFAGLRVLYYARDDWAAHEPRRAWWPLYERSYDVMADRGVTICAVSAVLAERVGRGRLAHVVPNGIDAALWGADMYESGESRPARRQALYTGTLDDRLSLTALRSVLDADTELELHLIGPRPGAVVRALQAASSRVRVFDSVGQVELARRVASADVCLVPHVRNPLTEAMSPLKLYEYLAAGRPVVATDLPPMRGVDPRVHLAEPADFGRAVLHALATGPASEQERQDFIAANSWESRCALVRDLALEAERQSVGQWGS